MSNFDGYSYYINEDSDEGGVIQDSSDEGELDEINIFLRGTPEQKRRALKNLTGDEASSSDDDFEKMMQGELEAKVKKLEESWNESDIPGTSASTSEQKKQPCNDDMYLDLDEEQTDAQRVSRQVLTNDDLLYDPNADDEDQKWVDMHRKRSIQDDNEEKSVKKSKAQMKANDSDAVLNCPACMMTLCVDCQRHALYPNQYRAMFVMNCNVIFDEVLRYKPRKRKQFKRRSKGAKAKPVSDGDADFSSCLSSANAEDQDGVSSNRKDIYHPVKCSSCNTEVAVYDNDEVYHFFNVFTGYT